MSTSVDAAIAEIRATPAKDKKQEKDVMHSALADTIDRCRIEKISMAEQKAFIEELLSQL